MCLTYLPAKGRLKGFQTAFMCHAYDCTLFYKANRTYVCLNAGNKTMPSEETLHTAFDLVHLLSGAPEHLLQMRLISGGIFRHIGRFNHIVA